MISSKNREAFQKALLDWFDRKGRNLPWRRKGRRDPYHVWLAEIMLQQTTVPAVIPYYQKFLEHYPTLKDLARAPVEKILKDWAGLGYYSRARNLHQCAQLVCETFGGKFPREVSELQRLPGIGPYTAAAIAAIAFEKPAVVIDGNIDRVISRLFAIQTPLPKSKPEIRKKAGALTPKERPGDYAEALMDLGAGICTPRSPDCSTCPVDQFCEAQKKRLETKLPVRDPKKKKPTRYGTVFWVESEGKVLVQRRPNKGLLGGMLEIPGTPWEVKRPDPKGFQPADILWEKVDGEVRHTFTHFHLILNILKGTGDPVSGELIAKKDLMTAGFPTVMKKVIQKVLENS